MEEGIGAEVDDTAAGGCVEEPIGAADDAAGGAWVDDAAGGLFAAFEEDAAGGAGAFDEEVGDGGAALDDDVEAGKTHSLAPDGRRAKW